MNNISYKKIKNSYYFKYTLCFLLVMLFVLLAFFVLGKSLVEDGGDGYRQRMRAMSFYSRYLRDILYNLFYEHKLIIPDWSFSIGQGGDIMGTLQYFAEIGDPIASLCVLVPIRYLPYFYSFVVIARLYLAGLFLSIFCRFMGHKNQYALLSGSMVYVFCSWAYINLARYPHWLFPMVYFPLVLLGIELVIKNRRPYLLTFAVMFTAMSNFYYFYLVVIMVVIYVVLRLLFLYPKDIKSIALKVIEIGIYAGSGVLIGAISVFPMLYAFTNDARGSVDYLIHTFFPLSYYASLFAGLISYSENNRILGASIYGFIAVLLLFISKKNKDKKMHKLFWIGIVLLMLFPIFGSILNGFSYSINRWSWIVAFFEAYILVDQWDNLMSLEAKDGLKIIAALMGYTLVCAFLIHSRMPSAFAALAIGFAGIAVLLPLNGFSFDANAKGKIILSLVLTSVIINALFRNFSTEGGYIGGGLDMSTYENDFYNNEANVVKQIAFLEGSDELYRYSAESAKYNAQISAGLSGTNYYWSISNPKIVKLRDALNINDTYIFRYFNSEQRTVLDTLEAVKYYAGNEGSTKAPYGYSFVATVDAKNDVVEKLQEEMKLKMGVDELPAEVAMQLWRDENDTFDIYRNDNALPLVYAYDSYIPEEKWNTFNPVKKQDVMLQGVVLEDKIDNIKETETKDNVTEIPVSLNSSDELYIADGKLITTKNSQKLILSFEGKANSENYLIIKGLDFNETSPAKLYSDDASVDPENRYNSVNIKTISGKNRYKMYRDSLFFEQPEMTVIKAETSNDQNVTIEYHTREFDHYTGRHDFAINLGYSEQPLSSVELTFDDIGVFDVDSFSIACESMDDYTDNVSKLNNSGVSDIVMDVNTIDAHISADADKIVCFALPYSEGFKAYVDGVETKLYNANVEYMAVCVTAGEHDIELKYQTPFKMLGLYCSVFSFICYAIFVFFHEKRVRRINK